MKISEKNLEQLFDQSKLDINDKSKDKLVENLSQMIDSFNIIDNIDTNNLDPMIYINDNYNVFRQDIVENKDHEINRKTALENAPSQEDGFITVPKVIEYRL